MSSSSVNLENFLIPLEEIKRATKDFSRDNFIGDGGFGAVYRGQLSEPWKSRQAAFKRLDPESCQGKDEFHNELQMISSFKHENIIPFMGYCDEGNEMIIVSEHASNGSLDHHLRDPSKMCLITWKQRLEICLGAAQGLEYLHSGLGYDHRVIHRDVKSANILLDDNLVAKICDFGLSRLGPRNQRNTEVETGVAGTQFYLDPVYHECDILSKESDVYSFGVVMFEMLCGMLVYNKRRIGDMPQTLITLVRRYYHDRFDRIIDPHISDQIDRHSLDTLKEIAYECISYNREQRPTMDRIIKMIKKALDYQLSGNRSSTSHTSDPEDVVRSEQVRRIFERFDVNKDGGLNIEEIAAFVVGVNGHNKISHEQTYAIVDEVSHRYNEFIDGEKGLTYNGLLQIYDDGVGDVDRDSETLGLELSAFPSSTSHASDPKSILRSEKVRRIFERFDVNKDGGLNIEEIAAFVVGVNGHNKISDEQICAIVDEVPRRYNEFFNGEKGLTYNGLLQIYDDGVGDVDHDFETLGLKLSAYPSSTSHASDPKSVLRSEKVRKIFQRFDVNKDGGLNRAEIAAFVVGVNGRNKISDEQTCDIVDEVFRRYNEFMDGEKGLTLNGLLRIYEDGIGDVHRDFDTLGLEL